MSVTLAQVRQSMYARAKYSSRGVLRDRVIKAGAVRVQVRIHLQ
jgi:hypothetical protein